MIISLARKIGDVNKQMHNVRTLLNFVRLIVRVFGISLPAIAMRFVELPSASSVMDTSVLR